MFQYKRLNSAITWILAILIPMAFCWKEYYFTAGLIFKKSIKNLNSTQITLDRSREEPFIYVGSGDWRPYCHRDSAFPQGQWVEIYRELKYSPNREP